MCHGDDREHARERENTRFIVPGVGIGLKPEQRRNGK